VVAQDHRHHHIVPAEAHHHTLVPQEVQAQALEVQSRMAAPTVALTQPPTVCTATPLTQTQEAHTTRT